jgi:hypothetical protein
LVQTFPSRSLQAGWVDGKQSLSPPPPARAKRFQDSEALTRWT